MTNAAQARRRTVLAAASVTALAALAAAAPAAAQDWTVDAGAGAAWTHSPDDFGDADIYAGYVSATAARAISPDWEAGASFDAFTSTVEPGDGSPSTDADGLGFSGFLTWTGERVLVDMSARVGLEREELVPLAEMGALAEPRRADGLAYGAAVTLLFDGGGDAWSFTPEVSVSYDRVDFDPESFDTIIGEIVREADYDALIGRLGATLALREGALRPDASAYLVAADTTSDDVLARRTAAGGLANIGDGLAEAETGAWGELGAGLSVDLGGAARIRVGASASVGRPDDDVYGASVSISRGW